MLTQFGSVDRAGKARILRWLQACLLPEADTKAIAALQSDPSQLPRLDAYLASQITEPRYMKGEFGLEIQSYIERAHPLVLRLQVGPRWACRPEGSALIESVV